MEMVRDEVFRLQDLLIEHIDPGCCDFLRFETPHRSGILSAWMPEHGRLLVKQLRDQQLIVSERGGYLRFAPHFYQTDEQMKAAAQIINRVCSKVLK
jgi:hypothetical protein